MSRRGPDGSGRAGAGAGAGDFARRVWTAHADAWQQHGAIRAGGGGAWAELPGVRLMASGLPHPQWNNADVVDPARVDLEAVRHWYRERGVPWGVRVPTGVPWPHGRHVLDQRLMGQDRDRFVPAGDVPGVTVRVAGADDLEAVLTVDAVAFDGDVATSRPWMTPLLHHPAVTVAVAVAVDVDDRDGDGVPGVGRVVGTGYAIRTDAHAGPAVHLGGVAVLPAARRRGIGAALSSRLLGQAYDAGARMATLQPDTDDAARVYARLGFVDAGGYGVHVDVDGATEPPSHRH